MTKAPTMGIGNQRLVIDRATGRLGGNLAHAHQLSEVACPPKEFVAVDDGGILPKMFSVTPISTKMHNTNKERFDFAVIVNY